MQSLDNVFNSLVYDSFPVLLLIPGLLSLRGVSVLWESKVKLSGGDTWAPAMEHRLLAQLRSWPRGREIEPRVGFRAAQTPPEITPPPPSAPPLHTHTLSQVRNLNKVFVSSFMLNCNEFSLDLLKV